MMNDKGPAAVSQSSTSPSHIPRQCCMLWPPIAAKTDHKMNYEESCRVNTKTLTGLPDPESSCSTIVLRFLWFLFLACIEAPLSNWCWLGALKFEILLKNLFWLETRGTWKTADEAALDKVEKQYFPARIPERPTLPLTIVPAKEITFKEAILDQTMPQVK